MRVAFADVSRLAGVRVAGGIAARFGANGARTRLATLQERGGYRLALPATFANHVEASQINTGGGIAGGDQVETLLAVGSGGDVVFSTQGAERVYRSDGGCAQMTVRIELERGARLDWLPQQTILYAGSRLRRTIDVAVPSDSRLLMVEMLGFGRSVGTEGVQPVAINDQWRIRRDGRLVFAEALRVSGEMRALLARPAVGGSARASALLVMLAPDAADLCERARTSVSNCDCEFGASAWNGLLCARFLASEPAAVIAAVTRMASLLAERDMPRVWSI